MIMDLRKMWVWQNCGRGMGVPLYQSSLLFLSQCLDLSPEQLDERQVINLDIAFDDLSTDKHYKREEDPKFFRSEKTQRGPLLEGWRDDKPIMCSYKLVKASFEVWGFQTRVEDYIHRCISDVLLLGHRQAFTWIDEWIDMTIDDVREYEARLQAETNKKLAQGGTGSEVSADATATDITAVEEENNKNDDDDGPFEDAVEVQDDNAQSKWTGFWVVHAIRRESRATNAQPVEQFFF